MKEVTIYTDGACSGNPGPGGWCSILVYGEAKKKLSGGNESTTNNRMEMTAVLEGLMALKEKCSVKVVSDSKYVIDSFQKKWIKSWIRMNWRKPDGKPVKNDDLWRVLYDLTTRHEVAFEYVKGHSGHAYNEECDSEARRQIELLRKQSKKD